MGLIRLFLALVVAADHLQAIWLVPMFGIYIPQGAKVGLNAGFAVMFFYVISGFLMSVVLAEKYEHSAKGTLAFYRARFIRIFSLYWPLAAILLCFFPGNAAGLVRAAPADWFTSLFLLGIDWRLTFAGWDAALFDLHQAWTLGAELTFYLLAPFLLRSGNAVATALWSSIAFRTAIAVGAGFDSTWSYYFFPSTICFFLLGNVAWRAATKWRALAHPAVGPPLIAASIAALLIGAPPAWDSLQFWISVFAFAAALPSIFAATRDSRISNALGNLSYPTYLVHGVVLGTLMSGTRAAQIVTLAGGYPLVIAAIALSAILLVALAVHWIIEKPAARIMRWAFSVFARRPPSTFLPPLWPRGVLK